MVRRLTVIVSVGCLIACGGDDSRPPSVSITTPSPVARAEHLISGTVKDLNGSPLEGVEVKGGVYFTKTFIGGFTVRTDAAGYYQGKLPEGTHSFSLAKPGYRDAFRDVIVAGDTTVDFAMQPGVRISGMISEWGLPLSLDNTIGVLRDATIEIIDGANKGTKTKSGERVGTVSNYFFDYVLPGVMRLRVTKEGYDPEERVITALADTTTDFTLKWAYGNCLQSVAPVVFDRQPVAGGTASVDVVAADGRSWTVSSAVPWLEVRSPSVLTGPQRFNFRILTNPIGDRDARTGQVMIRCTNGGGAQAITVVQDVDCGITLTAASGTPTAFSQEGGVVRLNMTVTTPDCFWKASSTVDWMYIVGIGSWRGQPPGIQPNLSFVVRPNTTGAPRVGYLTVSEARWQISQY